MRTTLIRRCVQKALRLSGQLVSWLGMTRWVVLRNVMIVYTVIHVLSSYHAYSSPLEIKTHKKTLLTKVIAIAYR